MGTQTWWHAISTRDYRLLFDYWLRTPPLARPVNDDALRAIATNRDVIIKTAREFDVSPVALAGVILAEASLHVGPTNFFEEYYVRSLLMKRTDEYLEQLADATEKELADRRLAHETEQEFRFRVRRGLIWTIGLCQMSIVKARRLDKDLAVHDSRPKRNTRGVIEALLTPHEALRYGSFELRQIKDVYLETVGIDIGDRPDLLATLYNTGHVEEKANFRRSHPVAALQPNVFGEYVAKHRTLIESTLGLAAGVKAE
jgi:hypothetical protein